MDERVREMLRSKLAGKTYAAIGEAFGVSRQRVQYLLARHGYTEGPRQSYHCSRCGQVKPRSEFYASANRVTTICKPCAKLRSHEYYQKYPERCRQASRAAYRRNKAKQSARSKANVAFPVGQKCEFPGCSNIGNRHHDDYDKPLAIRWLCDVHHTNRFVANHRGSHLTHNVNGPNAQALDICDKM